MSMFNTGDILETIEMFTQDNLDVRTVTMGISLLDCIDPENQHHEDLQLQVQPRIYTGFPCIGLCEQVFWLSSDWKPSHFFK